MALIGRASLAVIFNATALLLSPIVLAQSAGAGESSLDEDRLAVCRQQARVDPATAMVTASTWLSEVQGAARSSPHQCLGFAYTSLLRWDAAESSFLAARTALPENDHLNRARLAAMAGNAALANGRHSAALASFDLARTDAHAASDQPLIGSIEADRARALVGLERMLEATDALNRARENAPQDASVWLLSATLSRRLGELDEAAGHIRTAAALAPDDPAIALEAGLIAALAGQDTLAKQNWNAVLATAPNSPEAATARDYLAQLNPPAETGR